MSRSRYGLAAVLLMVVIAYASTIIGPTGPNYVPIDPLEALYRLIGIRYVEHGSDQRSDWMGNVVMLVPLGFLVTGWFCPEPTDASDRVPRSAAFCAFVLCFVFIATVKYAQVFFPPRTVTLNYVAAQSLGAIVGIVLFGVVRGPLTEVRQSLGRLESLRVILRIYSALLILFMLMPLDFALSADDIAAQLEKLPGTFTHIGGDGRPLMVRITVAIAGLIGTAPVGALLTLLNHGRVYVGRSISASAWVGFFIMLGVYVATAMVISGSASLPSVGFRTAGIALGAWFMHWLTRQNPDQIRDDLGDLVPWIVPVYLLTLFGVNGLLSLDWTTPEEAAAEFYNLGLLPLFDYYIVTKAQAAKNVVAHIVMYAPIGIMIWLRARNDGSRVLAFVLAAILSAIVETGRFVRPGLVPDINAVPLAGMAAWMAAALMPVLWQMLSAVAIGRPSAVQSVDLHAPALNWRDRDVARRTRRRERGRDRDKSGVTAIGDVEDY